MPWHVTSNAHEAIQRGYIGEDVLMPKVLPNAIRRAIGSRQYPRIPVYYCGTPDDALKAKFGYDQ